MPRSFCNRAIILVLPEGMDSSAYHRIGNNFEIIRVPADWQSSLKAYNRMKCSSEFYQKFKQYSHMLTYELDAYAFRDELDLWCAKPYDYIGAPWFARFSESSATDPMTAVGNSGFSLRSLSSCLIVTRFWENALAALHRPGLSPLIKWPLGYLDHLQTVAEDVFWSRYAKIAYPSFSVAPLEEARKFSFEVNPAVLYEMNGRTLPFGCHKWFRYDPEFWDPLIGPRKSPKSKLVSTPSPSPLDGVVGSRLSSGRWIRTQAQRAKLLTSPHRPPPREEGWPSRSR